MPCLVNRLAEYGHPLRAEDVAAFGPEGAEAALRATRARSGYAASPLVDLPGLAGATGVASIGMKDESRRFGLGSFKALGGAFAVQQLAVAASGGGRPMTFACATDGNHGRSVAQGARQIGAACVIFMHAGVSDARVAAVMNLGARVVRVDGDYDDSVREAARQCERQGWLLVSDTARPGDETTPRLVMQGYTVMAAEIIDAMDQPPTHLFIQAGVGGIAAALAAHLALTLGEGRPRTIVAEPARAACLFESARVGTPVRLSGGEPTVMAMLDCHEPSWTAWQVLSRLADAFITVDEDEAVAAMRRLASPLPGDPYIESGESGGVGLAALTAAMNDPEVRADLDLSDRARVLLINTEGATDPDLYQRLTGVKPAVGAANA